jgi:hypothetical protein
VNEKNATGQITQEGGTSEDGILKEGYLLKRGDILKYWKTKYFILCQGTLFVYKNDHVRIEFCECL